MKLSTTAVGKKVKMKEIWEFLNMRAKEKQNKIASDGWAYYRSGRYDGTKNEMREQIRRQKNEIKTIAKRTIQRCLKEDSRIKNEGYYYFIEDKTRYERRYILPSELGYAVFDGASGWESRPDRSHQSKRLLSETEKLELEMKDMIHRFGFFMVFMFLEAAKPFEDKSMSLGERHELVDYWVQNAIPINDMYNEFLTTFDKWHMMAEKLGAEWAHENIDRSRATNEMDSDSVKDTHELLKKANPALYKILTEIMDGDYPGGWNPVKEGGVIDLHAKVSHWIRGKEFSVSVPDSWKTDEG